MADARAAPPLAAPAAHSIRAADGTASNGFMMSGGPVSPNPSVPQLCQVEGMNCIGPSAPAEDGPSLAPSPLSIWPMAASTVQDRPGQYSAADSRYRSSQPDGRPVGTLASTGRATVVATGTRLRTVPPAPTMPWTCRISAARSAPGALIRTATPAARPSRPDRSLATTASTPGIPSVAAVPSRIATAPAPETT